MICILVPRQNVYSETFIRTHIEQLPAKIKTLYGRTLPFYEPDGVVIPDGPSLVRFWTENGVKAVLAEYGASGVSVMRFCKEAGIPLIVHFHGYDAYKETALAGGGAHYGELFEIAHAVIAVSRDMERQLIRLGAPAEKVHYNAYGVDVSLFRNAVPGQASSLFLSVGRFVDKKAPHLTLLSFRKVLDAHPDAKLLMIGDGVLLEACKQIGRALGIGAAVEFLGVRTQEEVATAMRQARAYVQHSVRPSHGDSEGTPLAILEAGAAGLPVIATKHGGIPDVITEGRNGFLVEEYDVHAMSERMLQLALDPGLADRMGKAARERICESFTIEQSIAGLAAIIESTIRKSA